MCIFCVCLLPVEQIDCKRSPWILFSSFSSSHVNSCNWYLFSGADIRQLSYCCFRSISSIGGQCRDRCVKVSLLICFYSFLKVPQKIATNWWTFWHFTFGINSTQLWCYEEINHLWVWKWYVFKLGNCLIEIIKLSVESHLNVSGG